jgi:PAS domain S-box-containing protein
VGVFSLVVLSFGLDWYLNLFWALNQITTESVIIALLLITVASLVVAVGKSQFHSNAGNLSPEGDEEQNPFFNNSIELMCITDTEGYLEKANPAFEKILGWSPAQLQGKRIDQMIHPEDQQMVFASFQRLAQGETLTHLEHRYLCRDGSYRWLSWNVFPLLEKGKIYGFAQDIQAQKEALHRQVETNHLLQGILDSTNDFTAAMDTEFRYLAFTSAYQEEFAKVYGHELKIGEKLPEALAHLPEEQASAVAVWTRALQGEEFTIQAEFGDPIRQRNYYEITYRTIRNAAEEITGAVQVGRDITQRQEALNALEHRRWESTLAENSPDVIARYDRAYRHLYINPAVETSTGIPRDTFQGKSLQEIGYPEEFTQMWENWLAEAFQGEENVHEITKETSQGRKSYQTRIVPEFDETGVVETVLAITRDITALKQAEEKLQQTTAKLLEAQEVAQLGNWEYDLQTQQVTWSPEVFRIYDVPLEAGELTFPEIVARLHPEDRDWSLPIMQECLENGIPYQFDVRIIRPNGDIRWLEARGRRNREGTKLAGTVMEITNRKATELALSTLTNELEARVNERTTQLQASENRFRTAIENAPFPIIIHAEDGEIFQINQVWSELTGYTHDEIPTIAHWTEKAYGDRQESIRHKIDQLYALNQRVNDGEFTIQTKSGQHRIWAFSSAPLGQLNGQRRFVISMANDVTERKQAQREIERQAHQKSAIAHLGQQALAKTDLSALFQEAVEQIATILDLEYCKVLKLLENEEELRLEAGVGWRSGLVGVATVSADCNSQAGYTLLSDQPVIVPDLCTETRFSGPPLLQEHNVISGMSVVIHDTEGIWGVLGAHTTQRRNFSQEEVNFLQGMANLLGIAIAQQQTETALRDLNQTLEDRVTERTQQLEEINEELKSFTYSISHDIRAPLRAIQGFTTALMEDYEDSLDELGLEYAQRINGSAQRLDQLVQDLLTYSRLSRSDLELKSVNLTTVVEEAQANLETEIAEQDTEIAVFEPLGNVIGNRTVLVQILTNLFDNGIKFTQQSVKPRLKVWSERKTGSLRLYVEDNGIGIEPQYHERIFRVFERLHGIDTHSGTGIGLAIVRKGMERLGGQVGVESSPGQGSRFWIEAKLTQ